MTISIVTEKDVAIIKHSVLIQEKKKILSKVETESVPVINLLPVSSKFTLHCPALWYGSWTYIFPLPAAGIKFC